MPSTTKHRPPPETTLTIHNPPHTYLHLSISIAHKPASPDLDEITLRQHLFSALTQSFGLTGTAIPIDILKLEGYEAWIRVPRDDEMAVVAALAQYAGSAGTVAVRVRGRGTWLGGLVGQIENARLWSLEA